MWTSGLVFCLPINRILNFDKFKFFIIYIIYILHLHHLHYISNKEIILEEKFSFLVGDL